MNLVKVNRLGKDVYKCEGYGQCTCAKCKNVEWTDWCYKLNEDDKNTYCYDCLKTILKKSCDDCKLCHTLICPNSAMCLDKPDKPYFTESSNESLKLAFAAGMWTALQSVDYQNQFNTIEKITKKIESVYPDFFTKMTVGEK